MAIRAARERLPPSREYLGWPEWMFMSPQMPIRATSTAHNRGASSTRVRVFADAAGLECCRWLCWALGLVLIGPLQDSCWGPAVLIIPRWPATVHHRLVTSALGVVQFSVGNIRAMAPGCPAEVIRRNLLGWGWSDTGRASTIPLAEPVGASLLGWWLDKHGRCLLNLGNRCPR